MSNSGHFKLIGETFVKQDDTGSPSARGVPQQGLPAPVLAACNTPLKSCPLCRSNNLHINFCGSAAPYFTSDISCGSCGLRLWADYSDVTPRWNLRTDPVRDGLVAALSLVRMSAPYGQFAEETKAIIGAALSAAKGES